MTTGTRFGHVNIIADDWRALADFYIRVLSCVFVPPERDYSVTLHTSDGRQVRLCYVTDPEGNIVELQAWNG